jgi:hypothetical protein
MSAQEQQSKNTASVLSRLRSFSNNTKTILNTQTTKEDTSSKIREQTTTIQSALGSVGLAQSTKDAQQALSEKYGIPTFDTKGNISTVPQKREIDSSINVGTGRFTQEAFQKSLEVLVQTEQRVAEDVIDLFDGLIVKPIQSFFESLFDDVDVDNLTPSQRAEIKELDRKIKIAKDQLFLNQGGKLDALGFTEAVPLPPLSAGLGEDDAARQSRDRIANAASHLSELQQERESLLRKYTALNKIDNEIKNRIERSQALLKVTNMTKEVKAEMDRLVVENRDFVNRVSIGNIPVTKALLEELVQISFTLFQRTKDEVTGIQETTNQSADFVTGLYGQFASFSEGISKGFESAFNPPQETTDDMAYKAMRSQLRAQVRIAQEQQK